MGRKEESCRYEVEFCAGANGISFHGGIPIEDPLEGVPFSDNKDGFVGRVILPENRVDLSELRDAAKIVEIQRIFKEGQDMIANRVSSSRYDLLDDSFAPKNHLCPPDAYEDDYSEDSRP